VRNRTLASDRSPEERPDIVLIVFPLLLLGILLGAVVHLPVSVSAVVGTAIGAWLIVFLVREYLVDAERGR
jgi:hypothetical protein